MIFQEPMTSLNPVLSIGRQLTEPLEIHLGLPTASAGSGRWSCWPLVAFPTRSAAWPGIPTQRRHAAAPDDCHGPGL